MPSGIRKNHLPVVYYAGHHMQKPFNPGTGDFAAFSKLLKKRGGVILKTKFYEGRFIVIFHIDPTKIKGLEYTFDHDGPFLSVPSYGKSVEKYGTVSREDFERAGIKLNPNGTKAK